MFSFVWKYKGKVTYLLIANNLMGAAKFVIRITSILPYDSVLPGGRVNVMYSTGLLVHFTVAYD